MRGGALKIGSHFASAIMAGFWKVDNQCDSLLPAQASIRLAPATILDDGSQRSKAVAPANFFALCISPTIIGNSHLEDPTS